MLVQVELSWPSTHAREAELCRSLNIGRALQNAAPALLLPPSNHVPIVRPFSLVPFSTGRRREIRTRVLHLSCATFVSLEPTGCLFLHHRLSLDLS